MHWMYVYHHQHAQEGSGGLHVASGSQEFCGVLWYNCTSLSGSSRCSSKRYAWLPYWEPEWAHYVEYTRPSCMHVGDEKHSYIQLCNYLAPRLHGGDVLHSSSVFTYSPCTLTPALHGLRILHILCGYKTERPLPIGITNVYNIVN